MFDKIRRFMGGGRKKKSDAPFKRSDSFRRISIKRHYLERGHAKNQQNQSQPQVQSQPSTSKAPLPPDDELVIDYGQWLLKSDEKKQPPRPARPSPGWNHPSGGVAARHRAPPPHPRVGAAVAGHLARLGPAAHPQGRQPGPPVARPAAPHQLADAPQPRAAAGVDAARGLGGGAPGAPLARGRPEVQLAGGGGHPASGSTKMVSSESKDSGFLHSAAEPQPRRLLPAQAAQAAPQRQPRRLLQADERGANRRRRRSCSARGRQRQCGGGYGRRRPRHPGPVPGAAAAAQGPQMEPMFFVPPEKRKQHAGRRFAACEIRDPGSASYAGNEARRDHDDDSTYERVPGDTDDDEEQGRCYVPLGVSPVPRRRPVVRRKKSAARLKYVARPHVARRAPSTLRRRKSTKKSESTLHSNSKNGAGTGRKTDKTLKS
ncbi:Hypothetical predicted protein [Cloeon dipterum]|uniref:Uncharacterized protein n=1 Tax=Cloeon dipterum TaxID=197152 RepID=A0A8S1DBS0_9INSE|nr:Hypothetical predicted protein [Cloeon dipterum]